MTAKEERNEKGKMLQTIQGQREQIKRLEAKLAATERVFEGFINRINAMALVDGQMQQSDSGKMSMWTYAMSIVSQYGFADKGVRVSVDIPMDMALPAEIAVPFGWIINELVSNAYEHAFPDGRKGEVIVEMAFSDSSPMAIVRDMRVVELRITNRGGVDLPDDFTFRDSESLGMVIVKSLVEQIDGEYGFDTNYGTRFKISFPAPGE